MNYDMIITSWMEFELPIFSDEGAGIDGVYTQRYTLSHRIHFAHCKT